METLQLMQRDMANFTIKQIRPYIQQNSIEYERQKFASFLEAQRGMGGLYINLCQKNYCFKECCCVLK